MATITAAAGGGNWNAAGTWTGGVVPTATSDVVLASTSGQVTITANASCRSLDCTGYTGTLTHNSNVTVSVGDATAGAGNIALKLVAGMTYTRQGNSTSAWNFISTSATQQTIDQANKASGSITFNGTGGSWKLTGTSACHSTATVTLVRGSLDTNGQTCTWGIFNTANANTRSLTLGASSVSCAAAGVAWTCSASTPPTFDAGTSTITLGGAGAQFWGGGLTYYNLTLSGSGTSVVEHANTFNNLTRTGTALKTDRLSLYADQVVGTFTATGNSLVNRLWVESSVVGTARTITAANVALTNVDFIDITGAGAATWAGTSVGNALGNSGITFTTPVTRYWVDTNGGSWTATTSWSASSGGASGATVPLCHDDVILDANSLSAGGWTITADQDRLCRNFDASAAGDAFIFAHGSAGVRVFGDFKTASNVTADNAQTCVFYGRGSQVIDTNGAALAASFYILAPGGTYTLLSDFNQPNAGRIITLAAGTLDANDFDVTTGLFESSVAITRVLNMGDGIWTLTGTGTPWNVVPTSLTLDAGASTIRLTDASATSKVFSPASKTYNRIEITGGGAGTVHFSGSGLNVGYLQIGDPKEVLFSQGFTHTIGTLDATGVGGALITIRSATAASTTTNLVVGSNTGKSVHDWLSLKDIQLTGTAFYAGANSVNTSNNSGIIWNAVPPAPFRGRTQFVASASGSLTPGVPHDIQEGALMLAFRVSRGNNDTTPPTGNGTWTQVGYWSVGGGIMSMDAWGKLADADETAEAWGMAGTSGNGLVILTFEAYSVEVIGAVTDSVSATNTITFDDLTTLTNDAIVLLLGGVADDYTSAGAGSGTDPTFTELVDHLTTLGSDLSMVVDFGVKATAGAIGDRTITTAGTAARNLGVALALRTNLVRRLYRSGGGVFAAKPTSLREAGVWVERETVKL